MPKVKLSLDKIFENEKVVQSSGDGIPEGTEAHFKCNAQANPSDVIYRWFINDILVVGDYTTEMVMNLQFLQSQCHNNSLSYSI